MINLLIKRNKLTTMKKRGYFLVIAVLTAFNLMAQPPQAFNYQAVVRNSSGEIIANQLVGVRINIRNTSAAGAIIYQESHSQTTNAYGLLNLKVGAGTPNIGAFSTIDWRNNAKFIEVLVDVSGGTNYISMGTSELVSTPYALYSKNSSDAYWGLNGTNIYYNSGNIGIGTTSAQYRLDVWAPGTTSTGIGVFRNSLGENKIVLRQNSNGCGSVNIYNALNEASVSLLGEGNSYFTGGNLGIGTTSPTNAKLQIEGTTTYEGIVRINNTGTNGASFFLGSTNSDWGGGTNQNLFVMGHGAPASAAIDFSINSSGYVGIGTPLPSAGLHLKGSDWPASFIYIESATGNDAGIRLYESTTAKWHIFNNSGLGGLQIYNTAAQTVFFANQSGNVGIGTTTPASRLDVRGNVTIRDNSTGTIAVELGTGLDYAEGFNVTDNSGIEPGSVLCIDPENPGKLMISSDAYDSKVAGIVAGANNLGSGISLGTGIHDFNVALAGRVYCNVDASEQSVEVGDLLTTSSLPGFAMKADNKEKAQGAILGKAMESLAKGKKGQILVLVTLQ
jgi:hypothetical protein